MHRGLRIFLVPAALAGFLAAPGAAQLAQRALGEKLPQRDYPAPGRGAWFTGDTHEHVQNCDGSLFSPQQVLARMQAEDLDVACVLIWQRAQTPFTQFVCAVTGEPDPLSTPTRVFQYGLETSGLDCSRWGHLIGLGIGPEEARIAQGALALGDCADMPGLALGCAGGDGTGHLNAPIAQHFAAAPQAVFGYAHSAWTLGIHHPQGYDWNTELLASGFTTDARCLDAGQRLAFPDLEELLESDLARVDPRAHDGIQLRTYLPPLGAIDAALGAADFFETTHLGAVVPVVVHPPVNWFGLYYKLLSAGLRVSITAGSDRACRLPVTPFPQTAVLLHEPFGFAAWTRGIRAGQTALGFEGLRLALRVQASEVGQELALEGPGAQAAVQVEVTSAAALNDVLELVVGGTVVATHPLVLPVGGLPRIDFGAVAFPRSTWVAARLASQRAHTAAVYVTVDGRPLADCQAAEYWMMWCDALTKRTLERPELEFFGCQEGEALARIARARRVFQTLRDVDVGLDPAWEITRRGLASAACRGPISIGASGPLVAGQPFRLTCMNAPSDAQGVAYVSAASAPGTCVLGARRWVDTGAPELVAALPVVSSRSGYAEVELEAPLGLPVLHAQFVWQNPPGCEARSCDDEPAQESGSEALELVVH